jgi:receptor protein-tyrosine kinase
MALAAMFVYFTLRTPEYAANGVVQLGMFAGVVDEPREQLLTNAVLATHRELLTSHAVVETAIRSLGRELQQEGGARREQREAFLAGITVEPLPKTFLVRVRARGTDPGEVVNSVNALMDAFIPFTNEFLGSRYVVLGEKLEEKEVRIREKLKEVEQEEQRFYRQVGISRFEERRSSRLEAQHELQRRLTSLRVRRASVEAERERLARRLSAMSGDEAIEELTGRLGGQQLLERRQLLSQLKASLVLLDSTVSKTHFEYVDLERKLEAERAAFREDLLQAAAIVRATLEELEAKLGTEEEKIKELLEELSKELVDLDLLEGEYRAIKRDLSWYDKELEATRSRLRLAQSRSLGDMGARIVNRAEVPMAPVQGFRWMDFILVFILVFTLGLVLVIVWDLVDDTVGQEAQVSRLGLPILARLSERKEEVALVPATSRAAEAFSLLAANLQGRAERTAILITSDGDSMGNYAVSLNVAAALARTGRKTLLIEANMRAPRILAEGLGVASQDEGVEDAAVGPVVPLQRGAAGENGLSEVLAGQCTLAEAATTTAVEGLDLLASGATPLNPPALILRGRFEGLITHALEEYEHVIVNAPPAHHFVDASVMSSSVSGVVYVVRLWRTRLSDLQEGVSQVEAVGGRSLGLVLDGAYRRDPREETD